MRRTWTVVALVVAIVAGAAVYLRSTHWKEFHYLDTRLKADLGQPDALIRTASLSRLPRDLLKVPIAKDVLTEELAFYYQQHEDLLGTKGAIKRIAYERQLDWSDRIVASVLDEPAEVALWRDGRGALRHFALIMKRNTLAKVLQEVATVSLKDRQLKLAGEIETGSGTVKVYALELNPRRTFLVIARNDRIVLLSDPGLLFDKGNKVVAGAQAAVARWLESDGTLARQFALDETQTTRPLHTLVVGAPTLALGYGQFMPGFKGLRFDFGAAWSTYVWVDHAELPASGLGDPALWRAAPANPAACMLLPLDWSAARKVVAEADKKPPLPNASSLAALDGTALACWYDGSTLYSPVFIARLANKPPNRNAALKALATWAMSRPQAATGNAAAAAANTSDDVMIWRGAGSAAPAVAAHGQFVVFSPDGALVDRVLDTLARKNPSVADQMPTSNATLALVTPRRLSPMAEREALTALSGRGDANLRAVAQTHLPARMKALASYPPYRLDLAQKGKTKDGWVRVEWRTPEEGN